MYCLIKALSPYTTLKDSPSIDHLLFFSFE
jgi:hypothetical protein